MAEPFLCKNCSLYLMVFMAAPFADLHSKHGRAVSVQRLHTVIIVFMAAPFADLSILNVAELFRAKIILCIYRYAWPCHLQIFAI